MYIDQRSRKVNKSKIGTKSADGAIFGGSGMTLVKSERVPIMFDKQLVERIDNYSYANRIRSRSEAIRRLVLASLEKNKNEKADAQA